MSNSSDAWIQAAQVATSAANAVAGTVDSKKSLKYSKQLMDYANKYNLEQWEREAEYNSPEQIQQRLLQAGINPVMSDMDYSQGAPSGNTASPMQFNNKGVEYATLLSNQIQSLANIDVAMSQAEKTRQETETIQALRDPQTAEIKKRVEKMSSDISLATNTYDLNKYTSDWQREIAEGNLSVSEKRNMIDRFNALVEAHVKESKLKGEVRLLKLQGNKIHQETINSRDLNNRENKDFAIKEPFLDAIYANQAGKYGVPSMIKQVLHKNSGPLKQVYNKALYNLSRTGDRRRIHASVGLAHRDGKLNFPNLPDSF